MAQVVVARHGEAPLRQPGSQGLVPQNVFRQAVADLHHRPHRPAGDPLHSVDIGFSVGRGEGKFTAHHGKALLSMIYWMQYSTSTRKTPEEVITQWKLM